MPLAGVSPAIVNEPPTTRSPLGSVVKQCTSPLVWNPAPPQADQLAPSQRATPSATTEPIIVNAPIANRWPFASVASPVTIASGLAPSTPQDVVNRAR